VLKTEVQTFLDSGPYFTVGAYDPATHAWEQRVRIAEPPPPRLGVIVGEYVHDVRSALDHLVWQLILLDGGTPTRATQLPITDSPADFEQKAKRQLCGISDPHRALLEQAQPYHAGAIDLIDHPLRVLRELSNVDKHQVVHATYAYLGDSDVPAIRPEGPGPHGVKRIVVARNAQLVDGGVIVKVEFHESEPPPRDVSVGGRLVLDLAFGETALSGRSLPVLLLHALGLIGRFEPDFRAAA